ncbi:hypothetical protein, partial [Priestia megaterium]
TVYDLVYNYQKKETFFKKECFLKIQSSLILYPYHRNQNIFYKKYVLVLTVNMIATKDLFEINL